LGKSRVITAVQFVIARKIAIVIGAIAEKWEIIVKANVMVVSNAKTNMRLIK
jgi:hypothetical protein